MQTIGPLCLESCCAAQVAYGGHGWQHPLLYYLLLCETSPNPAAADPITWPTCQFGQEPTTYLCSLC